MPPFSQNYLNLYKQPRTTYSFERLHKIPLLYPHEEADKDHKIQHAFSFALYALNLLMFGLL